MTFKTNCRLIYKKLLSRGRFADGPCHSSPMVGCPFWDIPASTCITVKGEVMVVIARQNKNEIDSTAQKMNISWKVCKFKPDSSCKHGCNFLRRLEEVSALHCSNSLLFRWRRHFIRIWWTLLWLFWQAGSTQEKLCCCSSFHRSSFSVPMIYSTLPRIAIYAFCLSFTI